MNKRILIFGASGMIGHSLFRELSSDKNLKVFGTVRDSSVIKHFPEKIRENIIPEVDIIKPDSVIAVIKQVNPDVIINAVGIIKQLPESQDLAHSLTPNSLWPHTLVGLAKPCGAKVIQLSSDCVYSGKKGMYTEDDTPDPDDIYGQTKWLGELLESNTLTIRTSTIGHELFTHHGLLEWFLAQTDSVDGYAQAIYSGTTTVELARILSLYIFPNLDQLSGVFHIGSNSITKYDLLKIIATKYNKSATINRVEYPVIDRSLDSSKFVKIMGYQPPSWSKLIGEMHDKNI